jgi:hypothetical protein
MAKLIDDRVLVVIVNVTGNYRVDNDLVLQEFLYSLDIVLLDQLVGIVSWYCICAFPSLTPFGLLIFHPGKWRNVETRRRVPRD